jgi:hypothetical protein
MCAASEPGRDAVGAGTPIGNRGDPVATFDPEYAAFRATLLSLARDGHRLLGRIAEGYSDIDPREVRDFLRRIDRFEEEAARHRAEPVRRWLHHVRSLILDQVDFLRNDPEDYILPS